MVGYFQWSLLIFLGFVTLLQTCALVMLWRRLDDLGGVRNEVVRLRSRVDNLEDRPVTRIDPPSTLVPSGPVRPSRRHESAASPTLIAIPSLVRLPDRSDANSEALGRRYGELWARAEGGESAAEIARDLGLPIGQIELILNLRKQTEIRVPS